MSDPQPAPRPHPIVLISPAMAIGSGYYRPLEREFVHRGWQARTLPRRGFERGQPTASRHEDWSYADEIDEIVRGVELARTEDATRPVILLGHSLGGQLVAGHEAGHPPADGVITIGAALPHFRHFAYGGLPLGALAASVAPVTAALGYWPKAAFGGPGARTLMTEWARMVRTGQPPFLVEQPSTTPALIISLGDDQLAPKNSVDHYASRFFTPDAVTRWHYTSDEVPEGQSNDHITWVRTPQRVVDHAISWWSKAEGDRKAC